MTDFIKAQLVSEASSNKIVKQGFGTFTVPALAGAGETFGFATFPHGLGTDNLLYQVTVSSAATPGRVILPWAPSDNRQIAFAVIGPTNLIVYFISTDSSGLGSPSFTVNFTFRILAP